MKGDFLAATAVVLAGLCAVSCGSGRGRDISADGIQDVGTAGETPKGSFVYGNYPRPGETLREDFDAGWRFFLGDESAASEPGFDDSGWRELDLPHDWAVEGDFSEDAPSGPGGGALPGGTGWYRKTFRPDRADRGLRLRIDFDGVYSNSTVWINGHELGFRPYGYTSFSYDLTPYILWNAPNVIAVRVDNSEQPNSRWYSGCGIYRNVWLTRLSPVHVAQWGTYITTEDVSAGSAHLTVRTTLQNDSALPAGFDSPGKPVAATPQSSASAQVVLTSQLLDAEGRLVAETSSEETVPETVQSVQELSLESPHLWDISDPYLYNVRTVVTDRKTGKVLDTYNTPVGIRSFSFDPQKGFFLNGRSVKINGVCNHHDLGCLGSAVNARAIERQLEILREMGCNGIRTSHNPPAPELLDLCDRMGFIVMDEAFDMWRKKKTAFDYSRFFSEWHERDLADMILRDRNHPSIFMWSIGNEVLEQWTHADADTLTLEQANLLLNFGHDSENSARTDSKAQKRAGKRGADGAEAEGLSVNSLLTVKLADIVRSLDPTRPITSGCNEPATHNHLFRSGALDIIGYNYHEKWIRKVPRLYPGKPLILTETVSALAMRGYYRMPSTDVAVCPERWDRPYFDTTFACSSYDNCHVPWGTTHEQMLDYVDRYDFVSGQYIWTGFDYLGEPTPYGWPARSSYFGIIDLCGFPKDVYYMYQSQWRPDLTMLHVFPHWNWTEGSEVDVWAYYSNADEAELYLNGVSQGIRRKKAGERHVMWRLRFEPGTVRVVTRRNSEEVACEEIRTAGEPAMIRLSSDRSVIHADGKDLSFITVEVTDADGNLCPLADDLITFSVSGAGLNVGVDNGCETSMERFKADCRRAFYGRCLLVVRNSGEAGKIKVTASAEGLQPAEISLEAYAE